MGVLHRTEAPARFPQKMRVLLVKNFLGKVLCGGLRGKLPRALPSHPLTRELSQRESLEDTEVPPRCPQKMWVFLAPFFLGESS